MTEQSRPALRQEHRFPQPVLHPHDTIFNTESDAAGLSVSTGLAYHH